MSSGSCLHSTVYGGLCVECGTDVTIQDLPPREKSSATSAASNATNNSRRTTPIVPVKGSDGQERFAIMHDDEKLVVTKSEAKRLQTETCEKLLKEKKLILVLDLDSTLIHATTSNELQHTANKFGKSFDYSNEKDLFEFNLTGEKFIVKFRPHLMEFMEKMNQYYQIHMYTMGTGPYASRVGEIIDPDGKLFQGRILSRDACGQSTLKDLRRLFPAGDQLSVVIDDRSDVWQSEDGTPAQNLLQIVPYYFFPVLHQLNSLPNDKQEDHMNISKANAENDKRLVEMSDILIRLHTAFFTKYNSTKTIKPISSFLNRFRKNVFQGVRLVPSGLYPLNNSKDRAMVLQTAFVHGAVCLPDVDVHGDEQAPDAAVTLGPLVTHVVARFDNSSKVRAAAKTRGVYLVSHEWFWESIRKLQKLPESDFPVGTRPTIQGPPREPFYPSDDENMNDDADRSSASSSSDSASNSLEIDDFGNILSPSASPAKSNRLKRSIDGANELGSITTTRKLTIDTNIFADDAADADPLRGRMSSGGLAQTLIPLRNSDAPPAKKAKLASSFADLDLDSELDKI